MSNGYGSIRDQGNSDQSAKWINEDQQDHESYRKRAAVLYQ